MGTVVSMAFTPDDPADQPDGFADQPDGFAEQVDSRKELLPEERAAGSDNPEDQAAEILAESEDRTLHPDRTRHESAQTPDDNRPGDPDD